MNNKTFWDAVRDLPGALFKTYSVINRLADNEVGYCFSKNATISEKMGGKHTTLVSADISKLIEKGYLFSLEIKKGFIVVERRLYTAENYKQYLEDKKNIENLVPTEIIKKDGIIFFTNERLIESQTRTEKDIVPSTPIKEKSINIDGAYYQSVRLLIGHTSLKYEQVGKLGKSIERIKAVVEFAKKYGKGDGWIYNAIKDDYSLDDTYLKNKEEKNTKIIEENKKFEDNLFKNIV